MMEKKTIDDEKQDEIGFLESGIKNVGVWN
jgi:hypothetical protein